MGEQCRGGEPQYHHREIFDRPEQKGYFRQHGRKGGDQQRGDRSGEERPQRGDGQSGTGAALARHLVPVDARHHG
ncbi:hypothetical protein D3C87_2084440 [compost metagenome]